MSAPARDRPYSLADAIEDLCGAMRLAGTLQLACQGMDSDNGRDLGELADVLYERIGHILSAVEEMRGCADAV